MKLLSVVAFYLLNTFKIQCSRLHLQAGRDCGGAQNNITRRLEAGNSHVSHHVMRQTRHVFFLSWELLEGATSEEILIMSLITKRL